MEVEGTVGFLRPFQVHSERLSRVTKLSTNLRAPRPDLVQNRDGSNEQRTGRNHPPPQVDNRPRCWRASALVQNDAGAHQGHCLARGGLVGARRIAIEFLLPSAQIHLPRPLCPCPATPCYLLSRDRWVTMSNRRPRGAIPICVANSLLEPEPDRTL